MVPWLLRYITVRMNQLPVSTTVGRVSPREVVTGIKTDYDRDMSLEFGSYCQVYQPKRNNELEPRTVGCIALCPKLNSTGSVIFLNLNTLEVIHRGKWYELPVPQELVNRMERMCHKYGKLRAEDIKLDGMQ